MRAAIIIHLLASEVEELELKIYRDAFFLPITIAHKIWAIARMDLMIGLDQGRIIEEGTHEVLLAKGGQCARYWKRQSGGFIGIEEAQS